MTSPDATVESWPDPGRERASFEAEGDLLHPLDHAASNWAGRGTVRGMATSSAMARAAERAVAQVLRRWRRLALVDVELLADDVVVARARGLFLRGGDAGPGATWQPGRDYARPPEGPQPDKREPRLYFSPEGGWTPTAAPHQSPSRKQIWHGPVAVVRHEEPTPFQVAAGVADLASVVTNWGSEGLTSINADIALSLARLPRGLEVGVAALEHMESDGLSVGTALVHDRDGVIGVSTVSAIGNAAHMVDPGARDG